MKVHELKIKHMYCINVVNHLKTFEIRKNDRDFKVDDILHLKETHDCSDIYTGFEMFVKVVYIHEGLGLQDGYVCMTIKEVLIR